MHSLQNVLIGMDIPIYENKKVANEYSIFNIGSEDDLPFDEDYFEVSNHFSSFLCWILETLLSCFANWSYMNIK